MVSLSGLGLLFIYWAFISLAIIYLAGIYLAGMGLRNIVRFGFCLAAGFKFDVFWERVVVCEQEGCQFGPFLFRRIYLCFCLFLGLGGGRPGGEKTLLWRNDGGAGVGGAGVCASIVLAHALPTH